MSNPTADDWVDLYFDSAGEVRWRYKAGNGETMADGAEGYRSVRDAVAGLTRVTGRSVVYVENKAAPIPGRDFIRVVIGPGIPITLADVAPDRLPHSRACGIRPHEHGPACHPNCPTCGGGRVHS